MRLPHGIAFALTLLAACDTMGPDVFSTSLAAKNAAGEVPGEFEVGEPITFDLASGNVTDQTQPLQWCGGGRFDLLVYSADGALVWNAYHGILFTGSLQNDAYGPFEERLSSIVWSQVDNDGNGVSPGAYYAIADGCAYHDGKRIAAFTTDPVDFLIRTGAGI